ARHSSENRKPEGEGLPGPGFRLAAHVAAGKTVGNGQGLDGKGGGDPGGLESSDKGGRQAEIRECRGDGFSCSHLVVVRLGPAGTRPLTRESMLAGQRYVAHDAFGSTPPTPGGRCELGRPCLPPSPRTRPVGPR